MRRLILMCLGFLGCNSSPTVEDRQALWLLERLKCGPMRVCEFMVEEADQQRTAAMTVTVPRARYAPDRIPLKNSTLFNAGLELGCNYEKSCLVQILPQQNENDPDAKLVRVSNPWRRFNCEFDNSMVYCYDAD